MVAAFLAAASVPIDAPHRSGTLAEAEAIRTAHPEVVRASLHAAAVFGDDAGVRAWLRDERADVRTVAPPHGWDALTHLCFSRYLRDDVARRRAFAAAAAALLDAGADARTGFVQRDPDGGTTFETALYGAAGLAHDEDLTRLLLSHGADPNDGEVVYHAPESYDLGAVRVLLAHGHLTPDSLATLLARKHDWHDLDGVRLLLRHGADPNRLSPWGLTALHQAVRRDNAIEFVEALLAAGADPRTTLASPATGGALDAVELAAARGRGDLLALFDRHGVRLRDDSPYRLLAACARGDLDHARRLAAAVPSLLDALLAHAGDVLVQFAGAGTADGVRCLLGLGVHVDALAENGDGYFGLPPRSTALHAAAWRGRHAVLGELLERSAAVDVEDGAGRTPLEQAVRACTVAHWRDHRRPDSIRALLGAGADPARIALPTGYDEADHLIAETRARRKR